MSMEASQSDTLGSVDVGYVDETESWKLESRFFPSKIGGRPAWLHLAQLPSVKSMECGKCHEPCIFLCQIYAPIDSEGNCFHRTLFIFICQNPKCCTTNDNSNFLVYRSQLKRQNEFYPYDPPEDSENWHPESKVEKWTDLCAVCGNSGMSHCGRCKKVKYCSRSHQLIHWKDHHKRTCNADNSADLMGHSSFLLPEYELIVEPEGEGENKTDRQSLENDSDSDESDDDDAENARVEELKNLALDGKLGSLAGDATVDADLLNMANSEEDKEFIAFKARIALNPGQVLRYQRGGKPLWLTKGHIPSDTDIPPCANCGSRRIYEFQILPQLLNHLHLDNVEQSIDWGVLTVYTCERSCEAGPAYKEEFLWKQDISG